MQTFTTARRFFGIFTLVLLQFACSSKPDHATYVNGRYGYEITYPTELAPQGEAGNGDGQVFAAKDAELRVWASACVEGWDTTPAQYITHEKKHNVTYSAKGKDFAVVSGVDGTRIFYKKIWIIDDWCTQMSIKYEQSAKEKYDAQVVKMVASFKPEMQKSQEKK